MLPVSYLQSLPDRVLGMPFLAWYFLFQEANKALFSLRFDKVDCSSHLILPPGLEFFKMPFFFFFNYFYLSETLISIPALSSLCPSQRGCPTLNTGSRPQHPSWKRGSHLTLIIRLNVKHQFYSNNRKFKSSTHYCSASQVNSTF